MKDTDASLSFFHPGMLPSKVLFPFFIFLFPAFSLHAPRFSYIPSSRENSSFCLASSYLYILYSPLSSGKLLTDPSRPNGPTFVGIIGEFYPALSLYGTNVKLTVHTGESYDA